MELVLLFAFKLTLLLPILSRFLIVSCQDACDIDDDDLILDWDALFSGSTDSLNFTNGIRIESNELVSNISVNASDINILNITYNDLSNIINMDEEYISISFYSYYKVVSEYEALKDYYSSYLGVTYIIDTQEFSSSGRYLQDANKCENRLSNSYNNKSFIDDYWTYTLYPFEINPKELGNDTYGLEYPNPNIWYISMNDKINDPCGIVKWIHNFTLNELYNLCNFNLQVNYTLDNNNNYAWAELQGTFYFSIVSPNPIFLESCDSGNTDCGQYLTKTLGSKEIKIKINLLNVDFSSLLPTTTIIDSDPTTTIVAAATTTTNSIDTTIYSTSQIDSIDSQHTTTTIPQTSGTHPVTCIKWSGYGISILIVFVVCIISL